MTSTVKQLGEIPRIGWFESPTPITELAELAGELGLAALRVKRDDEGDGLLGGSKVRKLDYLLATAPFEDASAWVSFGAIGSGHLTTLAAAARLRGAALDAVMFSEPRSERVLHNLGFVVTNARRVAFHESRLSFAVKHPLLLLGRGGRGRALVPPGATCPAALVGLVRAGLELGEQVASGVLPPPDRVVLPVGTGGLLVGLRVGLALAGLAPTLHAATVVERALSSRRRLAKMEAALVAHLRALGVEVPSDAAMPTIHLDRSQLGGGYGVSTEASRRAVSRAAALGLPLEPVYSGKAMAAVLGGALPRGEEVLFWLTPRRAGALPVDDGWLTGLPSWLVRRLTVAHPMEPAPLSIHALGAHVGRARVGHQQRR